MPGAGNSRPGFTGLLAGVTGMPMTSGPAALPTCMSTRCTVSATMLSWYIMLYVKDTRLESRK